MKNYIVAIWDRATYEVEAENAECAELQAQEWFNERKPNISISEDIENNECKGDIFDYLLEIFEHRAEDDERDMNMRLVYANAVTMLEYALRNDWATLKQFDDRRYD